MKVICVVRLADPIRAVCRNPTPQARVRLTAILLFWSIASIDAAPIRLGIMGDSISATDGSTNGEYPNWHTQLSAAGRVVVAPGSNQAVVGATSSDLAPQQSAIASLVQAGQLDYSALVVGGNDAVAYGYGLVLGGDPSGLPTSFSDGVVANIDATLAAIGSAGAVHQIVANIPDVVASPLVQSIVQSSGISPQVVQQFEAAIDYTNGLIAAHALAEGIPVLDLFALSQHVTAQPPLTLAGVTIDTLSAPDGFHPAPIVHGLVANMFIEAANLAYGAGLEPLSDQQLLQNAGFTPLPGGPTYFDVSPYVIVPEPSAILLALAGCAIVAASRRSQLRSWRRPALSLP